MIWRTCVANVTGIGISVSLALSLFAAQPHGHAHPFLCHVFVRGGFVLVGMSVSVFAAVDETGRVPGRHKERTKLIGCVQSSGSS